jgi:hypothetical protein
MLRLLFFVIALPILPSHEARAWGQEGHSIVAEIAQRRLSPAAATAIKQILRGDVSLASISSWADEIRNDRPDTFNWHFVDIPLNQTSYDPAVHCRNVPNKGDCVINAIARSQAALAPTGQPRTPNAPKP